MKHAVLIMAHGNFSVCERCIMALDDDRFDFYIHIDKKSTNDGSYLMNLCQKSKVVLTERIPAYWGHHSLVEATMVLIKAAIGSGIKYDYYHLISGVDMPLMTPTEMDDFFRENKGTEFVCFFGDPEQDTRYNWRMKYRYPLLTKYKRTKYEWLNKVEKMLYSRLIRLPRKPGTSIVRDKGWRVYASHQWWSITDKFVQLLADSEKEIIKYWTDCYVSDETLASTYLKNTPGFMAHHCNMPTREIDWERGSPYTYQTEDYDLLMQSKAAFARKFDPNNLEIVDMLYAALLKRKIMQQTETERTKKNKQ